MKRLLSIGILFLAAGVMILGAFHYMRAQGKGQFQKTPRHELVLPNVLPPDPHNPSLALVSNYITQGFPYLYLDSGNDWQTYLESAPTYFRCDRPCTLEVNQNVNVGTAPEEEASEGNELWLNYEVDGQWNGWQDVADVPADGDFIEATWDQTICLPAGKHWVWSAVGTDNDSGLYYYHNNYRVYTSGADLALP